MSRFEYENSSFAKRVDENGNPKKKVYLSDVLNDLFKGGENSSSLVKQDSKYKQAEIIKSILPKSIVKKFEDRKDVFFNELALIASKSYTLGNYIKNKFESNSISLIEEFENTIKNLFLTHTIDEENLKTYLEKIEIYIIPRELKQDTISQIYSQFIKKRETTKLLALIILAIIVSTKTSSISGNQERKYDPSVETLQKIWLPIEQQDVSTIRIENANILDLISLAKSHFENNNSSKAYQLTERLLDNIELCPTITAKNQIQCLYGKLLIFSDEYNKNLDIRAKHCISYLESCEENEEAAYLLSKIYRGTYYENKYENEVFYQRCFEKALALNCTDAVFEKIEKLLQDTSAHSLYIKELLEKIVFEKLGDHQKKKYAYYYGCYFELIGRKKEADENFKEAAELGYERARKKLEKKSRVVEHVINRNSINPRRLCIVNSNSEETKCLLQTLPDDYAVFSFGTSNKYTSNNFEDVGECIETVLSYYNNYTNIMFALFNKDEDQNIHDCMKVLDHLYNHAILGSVYDNKKTLNKFISLFDIYVKCDYKYASVFLDASISDMGEDIYFRTHICDSALLATQNLLYNYPLFLPCVQKDSFEFNITICGDSKLVSYLNKEIVAVGYMGENYKLNVSTLYSTEKSRPDATAILDPNEKQIKGVIRPAFYQCDLKYDFFLHLNTTTYAQERKDVHRIINNTNYYIIDIGSDIENILFAIELRKQLLRKSFDENAKPIIAVHCKNPQSAFLAARMTLDNKKQGNSWHNNYNLFFFGMIDSVYSYDSLINDPIEKLAVEIHESYPDANMNDYYSYKYNQDSCRNAAIGLRYRLFIAKCYNEINDVSDFSIETDANLANKYEEWLEDKVNENYASQIEQVRWNNFMISRGWKSASIQELNSYIKLDSQTNHKHMLAKLHPYIANWEDLSETSVVYKTIVDTFGSSTPPQKLTGDSVKYTVKWLKSLSKIKSCNSKFKRDI